MGVTTALRRLPARSGSGRPGAGLAAIWAAGILLRLILAPFTTHLDLYHVYSRAAEAAYHGHWFVWTSQLAIQMLHNAWLFLIKPLLPGAAGIWSPSAAVLGLGAQPLEFRELFLHYPHLPRALLLLKLPYLVADLGTGYLLTRLVAPARRARVLALWLLNPIVLYTSAVFGRHDSIAVLLVVGSLLAASRGRRYLGMALLGLGAVTRFFPFFLAPFFLLAYRRSRRDLAVMAGGLAAVWLLVEVTALAVTGTSPTLTLLSQYQHVEYLTDLALSLRFGDQLFLFPLAYALFLLWYYERALQGTEAYIVAGAGMFLGMFALTFFHPPYAVWLVPFLALTIDRDGRLIAFHLGQAVLLGLFALHWGTQMTTDLFLPLDPQGIARLPDPKTILAAQVPAPLFLGVVRSLFTALSLWMAYRIVRGGGTRPVEKMEPIVDREVEARG
ncbi:MAG: glycosyltransferase 87 family protein [Sphaerobacter sp.]|nr:glycosyltransferase 87 family protein [Sphaerobacter sp.]